ncbi:lysozyme inhibitor LprI family protein [Jannaschia formosa]|uniref:lysozyme inhibitor LprI family protein n=1 Tax=Jannaschia formosa TaxID=2259592 RepID=UPI000E1C28F8|nr:hypothetical protein [Jannaschia formosa]TFL18532.1 hypothetical protein DR046_08630 [Jannaschia formosa]
MIRFALALALGCPVPASAQERPSFDCARARTPTEVAVCGDLTLARLDYAMAEGYFARRARRGGEGRTRLEREQALWRRWRDTCGDDVPCLTRRYQQRIIDLVPGAGFGATGGGTALRDGFYEVAQPDGTVDLYDLDGDYLGTELADGTFVPPPQFIQVPGLPGTGEPPTPPSDGGRWLADLETRLIAIALRFLPPEDHDGYRALHQGFGRADRIERHVIAIQALSNG